MARPHLAARGCVQDTMPLRLWTTLLRLGNFIGSRNGGGNNEVVVRGILLDRLLLINVLKGYLIISGSRWVRNDSESNYLTDDRPQAC